VQQHKRRAASGAASVYQDAAVTGVGAGKIPFLEVGEKIH